MTSQPGKLTVSQNIKEIWQWNLVPWRNITWGTFLLKNHTQNVLEKLFPRPFLENQIWAYLWINSLKFYIVCFSCREIFILLAFILCQVRALKICWNFAADHLLLPHIKLLWKARRGLELISIPHLLLICCVPRLLLSIDQISLSGCLYFLRYWTICVL